MESQAKRPPLPRSATPSVSPDRGRNSNSRQGLRPGSSGSDDSSTSNLTALSVQKRSPFNAQLPSLANFERANQSTASLGGQTRPSAQYVSQDGSTRKGSPLTPSVEFHKHRRQHSQGFFEPSLPSASLSDHSHMSSLTASQIAAQAAFQHQNASHLRKRSQTVPNPQDDANNSRRASKGSIPAIHSSIDESSHSISNTDHQYRNGLVGNNAAATAASVAFPRNLVPASGSTSPVEGLEKETKSRFKRLRPKHIGISRDKEPKDKPLPSPNKIMGNPSGLSQVMNASSTSLADPYSSSSSSMYNLNNASVSAMPMIDRGASFEKEKKHTGLRQKLKLKDKDDHFNLPLSSANSNSRPMDANNPTSLYSFAPSSPGPGTGFGKSVSGLDLRHAGRALREKKKEEKANASSFHVDALSNRADSESTEYGLGLSGSLPGHSGLVTMPYASDPVLREVLSGFGLTNMSPDDAWDFLKAKILVVFEGEDVRTAVEDLNKLVTIHVQWCVQKRAPSVLISNLDDLFQTGLGSLNYTLRTVLDEKLVPHLVNMWLFVFGKVLPYMQAVFLPLDLEFKGRGSVLTTPKAAADFWGVLPNSAHGAVLSSSPPMDGPHGVTAAGDELEIRRMLLIAFRNAVILPRYDVLKATFSRLSLESIDASLAALANDRSMPGVGDRLGTPQSIDPTYSSYNSQSSTLVGTVSSTGRSRATSNTSNPALQEVAFESFSSPPAARPTDTSSAMVTETVGRMLQCVSVLASVQSGDEPQDKIEELAKELKLNWLGRGRTGRNRRGFVGTRVARPLTFRSVDTVRERDREGSPTPTPTRAGTVNKGGGERAPEASGPDGSKNQSRPASGEIKRRSLL